MDDASRPIQVMRSFRTANERLFTLVSGDEDGESALVPFLCECADGDCSSRIPLSVAVYAELRQRDIFLVVTGHRAGRTGGSVEHHQGFDAVSVDVAP